MGLFDKLFGKKECDICGGEIGLLGNRKLEDGNMCKECAAKLSPFFSERRESTVAEIKEQLAYREANKAVVAAFNPTKVVECDSYTLYFDEDKKQFMVTRANNWRNANPDVIDFAQVSGCEIDVEESKEEVTFTNKDGEEKSYNPPRYKYYYDFNLVIHVNHPYFARLSIQTNESQVENRGSKAYMEEMKKAEEIKAIFTKVREEEREAAAKAAAPKTPVVCPACGATTIPDANGCCEYCGSPV